MEKERTKNKSPAPPRGDHKLHASPDLKPIRFYDSEPNSHCQAYLQKNPKFFPKNFQNFEKIPEIGNSGLWGGNLILNRENLEYYQNVVFRVREVRARVGDKGILEETMFLNRNPNKKFQARPIRRHIEVNRANDVKDYWLARISRRPSLILRGFHTAPILKIHDSEAPELFSTEARIFNMSTWRSVRRELKPRYFVSCLVIDVDDVSLEEINERRERAPVKCSLAVLTSCSGMLEQNSGKFNSIERRIRFGKNLRGGFQLYFLFDKPYEETANFEGFKDIYDDLVDIYGADKRSHYDSGSYFCIFPYSVNSKHGNFRTLLIKFPEITYTPDEMRELIADYKGYKDHKSRKIRVQGFKFESRYKGKDFWDGTPLEREWVKLLGMLKNKKDVELWKVLNGIDPRIRFEENGSFRCEILITMLKIRGFSDQFILELVKNLPYGLKYGNRAGEMRKHPEYEESRIKALIKHANKKISEHPEFYILAKMERGKGYSYKAICKLMKRFNTGFNIAIVKHGVRVLLERGMLERKKVRKKGKWTMIFYKPMSPKKLQGRQGTYTGYYEEKKSVFFEKEGGKGGARGGKTETALEPLGNVLGKMFGKKNSSEKRRPSSPKEDTHEKRLATPLRLVNPEIVSELVKLEGRDKSEIKALYGALPKTNPLIAGFSEYLKGRELDLPLDEAFTLWVLQERARLRQEPKFYVGFT